MFECKICKKEFEGDPLKHLTENHPEHLATKELLRILYIWCKPITVELDAPRATENTN